jgi:hypothetical protein
MQAGGRDVTLRERFRRPTAFRGAFTRQLLALDAQPKRRETVRGTRLDASAPPMAPGPESLASEWWRAGRTDALLRGYGSPPTARLAVVWRSFVLVERCPEARWSVVDLGRGLDEEGLLAEPFDERSEAHAGPIGPYEPGPSRLAALITMAGYTAQLRQADRRRWRRRAIEGATGCPVAVAALVEPVRSLLVGIS